MKISKMPKASGHRARVVVFTQGMDDFIVAKEGKISKYLSRSRGGPRRHQRRR